MLFLPAASSKVSPRSLLLFWLQPGVHPAGLWFLSNLSELLNWTKGAGLLCGELWPPLRLEVAFAPEHSTLPLAPTGPFEEGSSLAVCWHLLGKELWWPTRGIFVSWGAGRKPLPEPSPGMVSVPLLRNRFRSPGEPVPLPGHPPPLATAGPWGWAMVLLKPP